MQNNTLQIHHDLLSFEEVKNFINNPVTIAITEDAEQRIVKCRNFLDKKIIEDDSLFYGINTGFGFLQNVQIDKSQIEQLQYIS